MALAVMLVLASVQAELRAPPIRSAIEGVDAVRSEAGAQGRVRVIARLPPEAGATTSKGAGRCAHGTHVAGIVAGHDHP